MTEKEMKNVGENIVKRGRGRPVGTGGNERPDRSVQTEPGDNTKYINHSLRLAELPKVSMAVTEQVRDRIMEYFKICAEDDMKPSVAGLALALDTDRRYLWAIRTEQRGKNPEVVDLLKKAVNILDLQMVDYMQNGKINPISGIFLMKNSFGYVDKQEVVVTPQSPLGDTKDTAALEEKYKDSVVEE